MINMMAKHINVLCMLTAMADETLETDLVCIFMMATKDNNDELFIISFSSICKRTALWSKLLIY